MTVTEMQHQKGSSNVISIDPPFDIVKYLGCLLVYSGRQPFFVFSSNYAFLMPF